MKTLLAFAVVAGLVSGTFADIQDPPSNDYGPTRKLGRGLSNFFIAPAEVFVTVTTINTYDGNSAAAGYCLDGALISGIGVAESIPVRLRGSQKARFDSTQAAPRAAGPSPLQRPRLRWSCSKFPGYV